MPARRNAAQERGSTPIRCRKARPDHRSRRPSSRPHRSRCGSAVPPPRSDRSQGKVCAGRARSTCGAYIVPARHDIGVRPQPRRAHTVGDHFAMDGGAIRRRSQHIQREQSCHGRHAQRMLTRRIPAAGLSPASSRDPLEGADAADVGLGAGGPLDVPPAGFAQTPDVSVDRPTVPMQEAVHERERQKQVWRLGPARSSSRPRSREPGSSAGTQPNVLASAASTKLSGTAPAIGVMYGMARSASVTTTKP